MDFMREVPTPCPGCGSQMIIYGEWVAKEAGDFSLAGVQLKFPMSYRPLLVCMRGNCTRIIGDFEYDENERINGCVFSPAT